MRPQRHPNLCQDRTAWEETQTPPRPGSLLPAGPLAEPGRTCFETLCFHLFGVDFVSRSSRTSELKIPWGRESVEVFWYFFFLIVKFTSQETIRFEVGSVDLVQASCCSNHHLHLVSKHCHRLKGGPEHITCQPPAPLAPDPGSRYRCCLSLGTSLNSAYFM